MTSNDENMISAEELVTLVRLAMKAGRSDVAAYARRIARRLKQSQPRVSEQLIELTNSQAASGTRGAVNALPVDIDSRLELLRILHPENQPRPIWSEDNRKVFEQIVAERNRTVDLEGAWLAPLAPPC